ncbi:hypothetical protein FN846DRAFT_895406 [Sphaerosporella brunnea]|uniref:Uncharacterized protein n=1 Tax=Sphaerosporella brunnea TaxID=1250544 RepID=A0A5J5EEN5_9PEZI|nr:hypothetical protein FN846DRAFT_895406 [Sphaerosporella brunnea]
MGEPGNHGAQHQRSTRDARAVGGTRRRHALPDDDHDVRGVGGPGLDRRRRELSADDHAARGVGGSGLDHRHRELSKDVMNKDRRHKQVRAAASSDEQRSTATCFFDGSQPPQRRTHAGEASPYVPVPQRMGAGRRRSRDTPTIGSILTGWTATAQSHSIGMRWVVAVGDTGRHAGTFTPAFCLAEARCYSPASSRLIHGHETQRQANGILPSHGNEWCRVMLYQRYIPKIWANVLAEA